MHAHARGGLAVVYIVGAGPGDPGLITVRALELLRRADVILYDRLIDPALLFEAKPGCTLIDVGKRSGGCAKSQDETTELLVEYGRRGLETVRLKGGDPFLFGRGGEEAERLADERIPFEIIPGVSALTGAAAYAGIPLTHRDYSSSVGIATGHAADGTREDSVRWARLAEAADTVVVFMGVERLADITGELMRGGKSPDTPAALIERGATASQRVVTGTLGDIAESAARRDVTPPALLVTGGTVALAGKLSWYRPGPLAGLRTGITRPLDCSRSLAAKLSALGAEPVLMPVIKTVDTIETREVRRAMERLELYDCIVFSSANGVHAFFRALHISGRDSRSLAGKTTAVIGPATGEALAQYGIFADVTATTFVAESLLETLLASADVRGIRYLLVRSDIGRDTLPKGLHDAGAVVEEASFYSTRAEELAPHVRERILRGELNIITFASSSTVASFFDRIGPDELPRETLLASIGPQTSKAIAGYGRSPDIEAEVYTVDGLVEAILSWRRGEIHEK